MKIRPRISISVPGAESTEAYFSLRVQQGLTNESSEFAEPDNLFVVSDIEGNFKSFYKILVKNKVIDQSCNWAFGDGHLVINGDCFDRGEQVTECLWLIYSLEETARRAGGYIHFILGNHEIMNMNGDWRYVHPKYAEHTSSKRPHTALYDASNELWRWLRTKNIIEKIGDILFVHGGIAGKIVDLGLSVPEINYIARPYYGCANEVFADPLLAAIYNGESSPFWYRGYYNGTASEEEVDKILAHFEVSTIITGHTVINEVSGFFNGKVINVNTDHAAGNSEALFISKGWFYRIKTDGSRDRLK